MSQVKELVGEAAEMMCLGFTDHEIIRILRVSPSQANDLILAAEEWNYEVDMELRNSSESYTEEIVDDMAAFYGED
jgi:orotate phosphoribosyltransferase-like protein